MLEKILQMEHLIFYLMAVELLFLLLAQLRTNALLKRSIRVRAQKKEAVKALKAEVKNGVSDIPVVKFEKKKEQEMPKPEQKESKSGYNPSEMAVLQEMMSEFFG